MGLLDNLPKRELTGKALERQKKVDAYRAERLDRQAAKKERRALKMSKKIGRGNIRANRAAQTAEGLRQAADRKRGQYTEPPATPDPLRGFED